MPFRSPNLPANDELTLVRQAQGGDDSAFASLVRFFAPRLMNHLCAMGLVEQDAEDVVQESFVKAHANLRRYDPQWRFSTWLFTIGRNLAVSHLRSARPALPLSESDAARPAPASSKHEHHNGDVWALARRILPSQQHEALWLRYGEDLSTEEVAQVLGVTPTNARVILHRARQTLGEALSSPTPSGRGPG